MRQYVASENLDKKGILYVHGKEFKYFSSVLRLKAGDMIYVRLLDGTLQPMTVSKIDSAERCVVLQCAGSKQEKQNLGANEAPPLQKNTGTELWLFQFIAKPPKMELILRQAVECGVSYFVPVVGEFCQKGNVESAVKKSDESDERWKRIVTEAREQSGSPVATKILKALSVKEAALLWKEKCSSKNAKAVVLYEQTESTLPIQEALKTDSKTSCAAICVGAEGGISPNEVLLLQENGFCPIHFETNILRCETAALYGIAAVQTMLTIMEKS